MRHHTGWPPRLLAGASARGDVVDPSEYLEQHCQTGITKRLQYSNPDVDAALKAQQEEFDPQKRLTLLQKAEQLIVQQAPLPPRRERAGVREL